MASKVLKRSRGFTLLEIIVSVGIMLVLMSVVVGNYNGYNDTQKLRQTALTLKNDFRFLQSKSLSGDKPQGCVELVGYQVTLTASNYSYQALCLPALPSAPVSTISVPAGVTFTTYPSPFVFRVLSRGTSLTSITTIRLTGITHQYAMTVSPSGDISDIGLQ